MQSHILIVDDDAPLAQSLSHYFGHYGFAVAVAPTLTAMRADLDRADHDLVVLEPMIEPSNLPALLRELVVDRGLPVILHSAAASDADRIMGLEMGADDYLGKPCNPRELLARIKTALRGQARGPVPDAASPSSGGRSIASFEGWRVDLTTGQLFNPAGAAITLSEGEFQLLKVFIEHPRQVLGRDQLLDQVHGRSSDHYDRAIDVQLCRLRRKLSASGLKGPVIQTVRNEGYMFVHPVTA